MSKAVVSIQESDNAINAVKNNIAHPHSSASFLPSTRPPLVAGSHSISEITKPLIQSKLKVGAPNDKYEQEADLVADQVMHAPQEVPSGCIPDPDAVQIQASSPQPTPLHINPLANTITPLVQRQAEPEEEEEEELIQTKASGPTPEVTPNIASGIQSLHGGGRSLSQSERHFFEPRIGHDFSRIHIHIDNRASDLASKINARAFTVKNNIVFGAGQYQPHNNQGRRLMAHELTHVVQQSNSRNGNVSLVQRDAAPSLGAAVSGGLSEEMLRQIARRLREAMAGWGTDEEAIYSSFSGRTQEQVDAIAGVYQEMYGRLLIADLRDELTDSEMRHLAIFSPTAAIREGEEAARSLADMIAHQLDRAMDRVGTDEEAVYAALTGRTVAERHAIKIAYRRLTNRELEADIRSEFSGSELTEVLRLLNQGLLEPEDELYLAMAGAGTDEATIFRVLEGLGSDSSAIVNLESAYRRKYGDLLSRLQDDLNAAEFERVMRVLRILRLLSRHLPDVRYSSRQEYGYSRRDTTKLYGLHSAPNLVPTGGFNQESTSYIGYPKKWENRLDLSQILGNLANDCGQYARHLIGLAGRTAQMNRISRPGIALRPASDLQPGEAYYIRPVSSSGGEAVEEEIFSPWNNTERVRKGLTNFHVATVVARDNTSVVTSEVNAAFQRVNPWFTMYQGNRGFYRTFRREYRAGGRDPELLRM